MMLVVIKNIQNCNHCIYLQVNYTIIKLLQFDEGQMSVAASLSDMCVCMQLSSGQNRRSRAFL